MTSRHFAGVYRFTHTLSGLKSRVGTIIVKDHNPVSPIAYTGIGGHVSTDTIIDCTEGESVWVKVLHANESIPCGYWFSMSGFTGHLLFK